MPSSKPTDNWYCGNWGLGVWPLMLWEDHEFVQRGLGKTSNPRFTGVIYLSLRRKLKKQKEFMTSPKRGQLLYAGLWVDEWCKSLIWCIFGGRFFFYTFCINNQSYWLIHLVKRRRKQIGRLPRKQDQTIKTGEKMAIEMEELAMQLENGLELSNMESEVTLIVKLVPWAVMKQNLSVKRWTENLAMEEVHMHMVHFWVQMKGIPPSLCSDGNISSLANKCGNPIEVENLTKARGFLRLRIMFQYERLHDCCYKCGRIGHASLECSATESNTDKNANEGSNSRAQRLLKKIMRQLTPMGRVVRGDSRTQDADDIGVIGEENLLEVPVQVENIWPHLEDIVEEETTKRRQRLAHNNGSDMVVRALHGLIRRHRPSVVFLFETKMKNHIIGGVRKRIGFVNGWDVPPATMNLIHTEMRLTGKDEWFLASWGPRNCGDILNCPDSMVIEAMNATLCSPISDLEIKEAIFNMSGFKAPGPDGFQGIFFHSFWDIIATEIHGIVAECLVEEGCLSQINSTNIALIPKLKKTKNKFEMGIKLDMNKAYDLVEWDFLEAIMEHLGFHLRWINIVMRSFGQQISCQKLIVYFGANIPALLATELCNILDMPKVEDPSKYLGIPTI
ncbi:hypothetical protein D8674_033750 [Pyrus ussuriensis x Pyrus communis]|uniref:CCHC-type domain-containing protein n=1 Tax=Pyrus ussuriensis x Pyrus communis TaxID=2448454 RepID=A0A5N5HMA4_9ROSA|nr:hypothetical protein D8674_033750 [Pyrus ussuriensis x Pyrus communis]